MRLGIIGGGNVGGTLGRLWAAKGHTVTFGLRDPNGESARSLAGAAAVASIRDAVAGAEVAVLATPWAGAQDALAAAGDLAGKVLIDCTNPIGPGMSLTHGHTASGAEMVASWASGARVVKAFNTTGANNYTDPVIDGHQAAMFLCGDDEAARGVAATLAADLGFEPVDCGPLSNARLLEPVAMLWIWLAMHGQGRDFAFGLLRRAAAS
jgi:predicted dinucleotide-binding enzyme